MGRVPYSGGRYPGGGCDGTQPPPDYYPDTPPPYSAALEVNGHTAPPGSLVFPVSVVPPRLAVQRPRLDSWSGSDRTDEDEETVPPLGLERPHVGSTVVIANFENDVRRWAIWTIGTALFLLLIFLVIGLVVGIRHHKREQQAGH